MFIERLGRIVSHLLTEPKLYREIPKYLSPQLRRVLAESSELAGQCLVHLRQTYQTDVTAIDYIVIADQITRIRTHQEIARVEAEFISPKIAQDQVNHLIDDWITTHCRFVMDPPEWQRLKNNPQANQNYLGLAHITAQLLLELKSQGIPSEVYTRHSRIFQLTKAMAAIRQGASG